MIQEQTHGLRLFWARVCQLFMLATFVTGFGLLATPTASAVTGAIFTTNSGGLVNVNIFASKDEVYLQGGPLYSPGPAFDPGLYYCKVTAPGGAILGQTPIPVIEVSALTGSFVTSYRLKDILFTASGIPLMGFDDTDNPGGEYKVTISMDADFSGGTTKSDNFKVRDATSIPPDLETGLGELCAVKFYDANVDGIYDPLTEVVLPGWLVGVSGPSLFASIVVSTPSCFLVEPGAYTLTEFLAVEDNWYPTTLTTVSDAVVTAGGHTEVLFGNVSIGAGGGKTLGFWSNKNGQKALGVSGGALPAGVVALLNDLNLRNANGSNFVATSNYNNYRTWLLGGTATNMSYMLSVQLTAMELNVHYGSVNGFGMIYAPDLLAFLGEADGLNELGFISVNALMTAADAALAANGNAIAGSSDRAYQEALKDALDDGNNNLNFVQSVPPIPPFSFVLP